MAELYLQIIILIFYSHLTKQIKESNKDISGNEGGEEQAIGKEHNVNPETSYKNATQPTNIGGLD